MKKAYSLIFIVLLLFTTGCWDKEEIEERLFVIAIGIDANEVEGKDYLNRLRVTYKYPNINAIGSNQGSSPSNFLLTANSSSIFNAGRDLMNEAPFPFYYKHLKIIILGKDLLNEKDLVQSVLDELNRDTKINKRVRIIAADRTAEEILKSTSEKDQLIQGSIYATTRNNRYTSSFTSKALTEIITDFDIAGVSLIPKMSLKENGDYVVSGGCILKDYKFLDWVDKDDNKIINLINGNVFMETIDTFYDDNVASYAVTDTKTKKNINIDEKITADIKIDIEGYLQGYVLSNEQKAGDLETIEEIERAIEDKLMNMTQKTLSYLQKKKVDLIGIGEKLSKFHPKEWEDLKDNWDEVFAEMEFNIDINVKIRRTALTK